MDDLARYARVPVVNALSDMWHPCQALADMQTLREHFGSLRGLKLAFVGDGNNVAQSLMLCAARLGMDFALANPPRYDPSTTVVAQARVLAEDTGSSIVLTNDPNEAAHGAHAIYTDVWASMGAENEAAERRTAFQDLSGGRRSYERGEAERGLHALPAREARRGSDGQRDGIAALGGVRSGGKPAARAEGAAVDALSMSEEKPAAMKLWGGRFETGPSEVFERFSNSLHFDKRLLEADVQGSQAFARSLARAGVLTDAECDRILRCL